MIYRSILHLFTQPITQINSQEMDCAIIQLKYKITLWWTNYRLVAIFQKIPLVFLYYNLL